MQLLNIPIKKVDEVWSLVKKNIQEALSYSGNHTDSDFVYQTIQDGKFQLWIVWDESKNTVQEQYNGVVVTEIIQRKLKIGYSRAGRLVDELEALGIISGYSGSKARNVLVDESYLDKIFN